MNVSIQVKFQHGYKHPNWKGGRNTDIEGYIRIKKWDHPYHDSRGYVREHRLVMEEKLGRYLKPDEDIHHINGNKQDNRVENLQLLSHGEHNRRHKLKDMSDRKCLICGSKETRIEKNGTPHWRRGICDKCYRKAYYHRKAGSSRITPSMKV